MVLAVEPMVTAGRHMVRMGDDGWAIYSQDGSLAAHFEFTIADHGGGSADPHAVARARRRSRRRLTRRQSAASRASGSATAAIVIASSGASHAPTRSHSAWQGWPQPERLRVPAVRLERRAAREACSGGTNQLARAPPHGPARRIHAGDEAVIATSGGAATGPRPSASSLGSGHMRSRVPAWK